MPILRAIIATKRDNEGLPLEAFLVLEQWETRPGLGEGAKSIEFSQFFAAQLSIGSSLKPVVYRF